MAPEPVGVTPSDPAEQGRMAPEPTPAASTSAAETVAPKSQVAGNVGTNFASAASSAGPPSGEGDESAEVRDRCSGLTAVLPTQRVDPSALQALQQLDKEEALRILDEVEGKSDLRNTSAFIMSKVQKARLRALLDRWGEQLDREARQLLRSVPTRRAVEVLELAEAQRSAIRNPSAFVCSAVKDKARWPPPGPAGVWPEAGWPPWPGTADVAAAWAQAAYGAYGAYAGAYAAAAAAYSTYGWPGSYPMYAGPWAAGLQPTPKPDALGSHVGVARAGRRPGSGRSRPGAGGAAPASATTPPTMHEL